MGAIINTEMPPPASERGVSSRDRGQSTAIRPAAPINNSSADRPVNRLPITNLPPAPRSGGDNTARNLGIAAGIAIPLATVGAVAFSQTDAGQSIMDAALGIPPAASAADSPNKGGQIPEGTTRLAFTSSDSLNPQLTPTITIEQANAQATATETAQRQKDIADEKARNEAIAAANAQAQKDAFANAKPAYVRPPDPTYPPASSGNYKEPTPPPAPKVNIQPAPANVNTKPAGAPASVVAKPAGAPAAAPNPSGSAESKPAASAPAEAKGNFPPQIGSAPVTIINKGTDRGVTAPNYQAMADFAKKFAPGKNFEFVFYNNEPDVPKGPGDKELNWGPNVEISRRHVVVNGTTTQIHMNLPRNTDAAFNRNFGVNLETSMLDNPNYGNDVAQALQQQFSNPNNFPVRIVS